MKAKVSIRSLLLITCSCAIVVSTLNAFAGASLGDASNTHKFRAVMILIGSGLALVPITTGSVYWDVYRSRDAFLRGAQHGFMVYLLALIFLSAVPAAG